MNVQYRLQIGFNKSSSWLAMGLLALSLLLVACDEGSLHQPLTDNGQGQQQGGTGGKPGGGDSGAGGVSFLLLHANIFVPKCTQCHSGASAPKGLDLSTPEKAYKNLVGVASKDRPSVLRVTAGNSSPEASYVVAKIIDDGQFRNPPRMPLVGGNLSKEEIQAIQDWIDEGALP